jgi:hypothetical protein
MAAPTAVVDVTFGGSIRLQVRVSKSLILNQMEENRLIGNKAVVMDLTTLETPDESFCMVLFKLLMPVPNEAELREFYMGTTRRISKHMGRIDEFRVFTSEEMTKQKQREIEHGVEWLNRKLNKALKEGIADHNKPEEKWADLIIPLDKERYSEIKVVEWNTEDTSYVTKAKEVYQDRTEAQQAILDIENSRAMKMIQNERREQVMKHGFTIEKDRELYKNGELVMVANALINKDITSWPKGAMEMRWWWKFMEKSRIDQYKIAGALLMAEEERLVAFNKYERDIEAVAKAMESLIRDTPKPNEEAGQSGHA